MRAPRGALARCHLARAPWPASRSLQITSNSIAQPWAHRPTELRTRAGRSPQPSSMVFRWSWGSRSTMARGLSAGLKQISVTTAPGTFQNPCQPSIVITGGGISAAAYVTPGSGDDCVGPNVHVPRGAALSLTPSVACPSQYWVIDSDGQITTEMATFLCDLYASDGALPNNVPGWSPCSRSFSWTAPAVATSVTQWFLVTDARGGVSACRYTLQVE